MLFGLSLLFYGVCFVWFVGARLIIVLFLSVCIMFVCFVCRCLFCVVFVVVVLCLVCVYDFVFVVHYI